MRNTKYWSEEAGKKIMAIQNNLDPEMRICEYINKGNRSGRDGLPNKLLNIVPETAQTRPMYVAHSRAETQSLDRK